MQNTKMRIPKRLRSKKLFRHILFPYLTTKGFLVHSGYWLKYNYYSTQALDRSLRQCEKHKF